MGTYYHYAFVHSRLLIWWTDSDGVEHEKWITGAEVKSFEDMANRVDFKIQRELRWLALGESRLDADAKA